MWPPAWRLQSLPPKPGLHHCLNTSRTLEPPELGTTYSTFPSALKRPAQGLKQQKGHITDSYHWVYRTAGASGNTSDPRRLCIPGPCHFQFHLPGGRLDKGHNRDCAALRLRGRASKYISQRARRSHPVTLVITLPRPMTRLPQQEDLEFERGFADSRQTQSPDPVPPHSPLNDRTKSMATLSHECRTTSPRGRRALLVVSLLAPLPPRTEAVELGSEFVIVDLDQPQPHLPI